ncbi:dimethyladenosine transferase 1, mitochondrial [Lethenteron reissneri]|uniref:dimethyladenosine transferase 1, mitochondrial n=1 Tax=Lethenteron reissneri TaxID=7753 RepID=UPI002AB66C45|nr:dimethyladenosine transferase 1, mitochondrial [Lethenteron reissneri]XP_061430867.1 dimethyladenosine transferase 1, mitochondrial [Lethenteron reissneri]XP_061430868.1 dimethyladenosine transferase 1, mitochondrial [Lethenteron reissneri]
MAASAGLRLPPLPTIGEIIRVYNLRAQKQLSQNFLLNQRLSDKIVRQSGSLRDAYVCEVGPGPGSLTRAILERGAARVLAIEKDPRFLPSLRLLSEAAPGRMEVVLGDILTYPLDNSFPESLRRRWDEDPPNIHIIGNLPFSVSTALVIDWLECMANRSGPFSYGRTRLTLTFQKEVAERLVASVHSSQRCRLSVMAQSLSSVKLRFVIPGSAFVPAPKVDVGVVTLEPLVTPRIQQPFPLVEKVVRNLFQFRRKYCLRGIELLFPQAERLSLSQRVLCEGDVSPVQRPAELSVRSVGRLCGAYAALCLERPSLVAYDYRLELRDARRRSLARRRGGLEGGGEEEEGEEEDRKRKDADDGSSVNSGSSSS